MSIRSVQSILYSPISHSIRKDYPYLVFCFFYWLYLRFFLNISSPIHKKIILILSLIAIVYTIKPILTPHICSIFSNLFLRPGVMSIRSVQYVLYSPSSHSVRKDYPNLCSSVFFSTDCTVSSFSISHRPNKLNYALVRYFWFLAVVNMNIRVFWNVVSCIFRNQTFARNCRLWSVGKKQQISPKYR